MEASIEWSGADPEEAAERFEAFADELPERLEQAVEDIVIHIEGQAKRGAPVDTGRLRASIDHAVENVAEGVIEGSIGTNVEYALFVELDDPYMRPAIEESRGYIEDRVREALNDAWEAAA